MKQMVRSGLILSICLVMSPFCYAKEIQKAELVKREELAIENMPETVTLTRDQAVKIMKVLEHVMQTYAKEGSLDLVNDGARAALNCCGQLADLVTCLQNLEVAVANNQLTLVSLLDIIIGCTCT